MASRAAIWSLILYLADSADILYWVLINCVADAANDHSTGALNDQSRGSDSHKVRR